MDISLRYADQNDISICSDIFYRSVTKLAPEFYTPDQVIAWAKSSSDTNKFTKFILNADTFLACTNSDQVIGFCGVESNGHITSLYVDPEFSRQGVGTKLLNHIIAHSQKYAPEFLYAETSYFSKKVFLRAGFQIAAIEEIEHNGVHFTRFIVELRI